LRSSSGQFYIALDHVRALAIFIVFTWHFIHGSAGTPVPFQYIPRLFFFAILDEGHTGVALFMALSGYLFAKILDGRHIDYKIFLWNRFLRLMPLLILTTVISGMIKFHQGDLMEYLVNIGKGIVAPKYLPDGGWRIMVEFHFYLVLPFLLWMLRRSVFQPIVIILAMILLRFLAFLKFGEVQTLAYWTIIGRIDQFVLGMIMFRFGSFFARRHALAVLVILAFLLFYWIFDLQGGFYFYPYYPSSSPLWVIMPTVEGLAYAICIAWYDNSFSPENKGISRFIGAIGTYSYSIYMFHFFIVAQLANFVHTHVMDLTNIYVACFWSFICFPLVIPIGYLSFRFIESPLLKLRKPYVLSMRNA